MSEESQVWANQVGAPMRLADGTVLTPGPQGYAVHNGKLYYPRNDGRGGYYVANEGAAIGDPFQVYNADGSFSNNGVLTNAKFSDLAAMAALSAVGMGMFLPAMGAGGATAGAGAVGGAGGFVGEGVASGIGAWDGAMGGAMLGADAASVGGIGAAAAGGVGGAGGGVAGALSSMVPTTAGGWASLIGPAASVVSGLISADAARDASGAQIAAGDRAIAAQTAQLDKVMQLLAPYVAAGTGNLKNYQDLAGSNGTGPQRAAIDALVAGPEFAHLIKQGESAILQNASATGGLRGGNVQAGLAGFRADETAKLIDRQLGRYGGLVQLGQNSAVGVGNAGMTTAGRVGDIIIGQGAAQAGSEIAGANAINNTIGTVGGILSSRMAAGRAF